MKMQGIGVCSAVSLTPKVVPPPTDPTDEETELPSDEDIEELEDGSRFFFWLWGIHLCFFLSIRFFPQNAIRFYVFGIFKYFPCTKIGMSRDISGMFHPSKWNNMMYFFLKVCSIIHPWFDGFGKHVPFFLWKMMYFWYVPSSLKMECLLFSKDLPVVWDPLTWIPNHRAPNKHDFSHIFFIGIYGKITDITIDFWPQHYKVNHRTDDWSMFLITNHIYIILYIWYLIIPSYNHHITTIIGIITTIIMMVKTTNQLCYVSFAEGSRWKDGTVPFSRTKRKPTSQKSWLDGSLLLGRLTLHKDPMGLAVC